LHVNWELGSLTEGWVALQTLPGPRYGSAALTRQVATGATRDPHWIVTGDSVRWWFLHRLAGRTDGWSATALSSLLPPARPVALHAHFGPVAWAHRRLAQRLDAALIAAFYGADACSAEFLDSATWRRRYRRLFDTVDAVLAEGPSMAERITALGCAPDKVHVVRLPADENRLARLSWAPPTDRFRIVAGARFTEKKGLDTAIASFARGLRDKRDAELVLLGGGELEAELRHLSRSLGVADRVIFPGLLPYGEFMDAFAAAHVGVFPSRTAANGDSEGGAPVTLIEASWIGVPSVVSDHDDLPFIAGPERSIVISNATVDEWAGVLRELYADRARLLELSQAAAPFVRERHSPRTNAMERERIYDEVAA
jgi:colanic acid/amylovoran/stewartan biosynthesis glycosyltransferase WcaL/AmsK/CpsK